MGEIPILTIFVSVLEGEWGGVMWNFFLLQNLSTFLRRHGVSIVDCHVTVLSLIIITKIVVCLKIFVGCSLSNLFTSGKDYPSYQFTFSPEFQSWTFINLWYDLKAVTHDFYKLHELELFWKIPRIFLTFSYKPNFILFGNWSWNWMNVAP